MAVTHPKVSAIADSGDETEVRPSEWNAAHLLASPIVVTGIHGLDYNPTADGDVDLITVGVTGTPRLWWDEATDSFQMNKGLILPAGAGGLGDYDLTIGDVDTPSYGIVRVGDSLIGRTSYKVGALDLDGAIIIRNMGGPVTGQIEFVIAESGGGAIRFALPKSGVGNATYNPRSMLIAGPAVNDDDIVTVGYWQTQGIFHNLACDTSGIGADLGVQNDLEVEGDIFTDSIKESTPGAGITIAHALGVAGNVGYYGTTPIAKQTGVAVTAAGIHAALVNLGLIAA